MKISQMTTDQASDVLVRIAPPASSIMRDKKTVDVVEKLANSSTDSPIKFIAGNLTAVVTVLLHDHRKDVYEIVAALSGKTTEEIGKQKITATILDVKDSFDEELLDFFGSLK